MPWYRHLALLDEISTEDGHHRYTAKAPEHGCSRNVLVMQIEHELPDEA